MRSQADTAALRYGVDGTSNRTPPRPQPPDSSGPPPEAHYLRRRAGTPDWVAHPRPLGGIHALTHVPAVTGTRSGIDRTVRRTRRHRHAAATGSIDTREIKNSTIRGKDVKNKSLTGGDVKGNSVTGTQVNEGRLPRSPPPARQLGELRHHRQHRHHRRERLRAFGTVNADGTVVAAKSNNITATRENTGVYASGQTACPAPPGRWWPPQTSAESATTTSPVRQPRGYVHELGRLAGPDHQWRPARISPSRS